MLNVTNVGERSSVAGKAVSWFWRPGATEHLASAAQRPVTVTEIVDATGMSQSNTSNHLRCLRECGLVTAEQQGKFALYRLSDDRVGDLLAIGESLLADVARGVYECTRYNLPQGRSQEQK